MKTQEEINEIVEMVMHQEVRRALYEGVEPSVIEYLVDQPRLDLEGETIVAVERRFEEVRDEVWGKLDDILWDHDFNTEEEK